MSASLTLVIVMACGVLIRAAGVFGRETWEVTR